MLTFSLNFLSFSVSSNHAFYILTKLFIWFWWKLSTNITESPDEYPCSTSSTPLSNLSNLGRRSSYRLGKGMVRGTYNLKKDNWGEFVD